MPTVAMQSINGIPVLGFGTYPLRGSEALRAVSTTLELGFRHIDTAQMYGNESSVGKAVAASGVPRHELYIVTKVDPGNLGASRFSSSVARSMQDLGGPADLLLIHWPPPENDFDATVERLIAEKEKGMAAQIGVSNFSVAMLRRAQELAKGAIICNQVEFHPLLDQSRLLNEARKLGIVLTAFSPLAKGAALTPQIIKEIARKLQRPPSEIVLRWILQQGVAAIPMTTKRDHALSNLNALQFNLTGEDMAAISRISTRAGRIINPSWMKSRWD